MLGFAFVEWSEEIVRKEYVWMIPLVVRTSVIRDTVGGWGAMLAKYLQVHLIGPQGLMTAGLVIMIDGQPLHMHAKLVDVCADYEGICMAWVWMGAAPMRPCLRCANVFRKETDLAGRLARVEITCCNPHELAERSNE